MGLILLAILGGAIIIGLASYAGFLFIKIKNQEKIIKIQEEVAIKRRNDKIFDSVKILCTVGITQQCDVSEITIRIASMLEHLQGEDAIDFEAKYPAMAELFSIVKDMARADDRQQLDKQDRMKENLLRQKAEVRLSSAVIDELTALSESIESSENPQENAKSDVGEIPIKMI